MIHKQDAFINSWYNQRGVDPWSVTNYISQWTELWTGGKNKDGKGLSGRGKFSFIEAVPNTA